MAEYDMIRIINFTFYFVAGIVTHGAIWRKSVNFEMGDVKMKWLKKSIRLSLITLVMLTMFSITAFAAGENLFEVADSIIRDVYNQIAGISTVLAGLMSAVAVVGAKMSSNQHKVDQSWDWLKRIWIAWGVINGIGAFISYIVPLFNGYNVLP